MKIIKTKIENAIILEPLVFRDERGYFYEIYNNRRYKDAGISLDFVQDNRSHSKKNVLRGLHFQKQKPQGKLVTVTEGTVFDVAVDLRPKSKTFGQHISVILSSDNHREFYIPPGFAHGFFVMSDYANFYYKCTDYYDPTDEAGIIWNDKLLDINWPSVSPIISNKDETLSSFISIENQLINGWNE